MAGHDVKLMIQIDPAIMKRLSEAAQKAAQGMNEMIRAEARALMGLVKIFPASRDFLIAEFRAECGRHFGDYADDAFEYMIGAARLRAETSPFSLEDCLNEWRRKMRTTALTPYSFPVSMKGWERRKRETRELIVRLEEWLKQ